MARPFGARSGSDRETPHGIEALTRRAAATPGLIPLGGGLPSAVQFPRAELAASFLRVLTKQGTPALQYGWPEGLESLRRWVAEWLVARGFHGLTAADVIITNGAQQALALATQVLARPGQSVAVDPQSYPSALDLFVSRDLQRVPLTSPKNAHVYYVMPAVANPGGGTMNDAARAALLARRRPVIEDDAYGDLLFAGSAPAPLAVSDPERVFFVGTFSKTLCPGLRVGWLVVPSRWRRRALHLKQAADLQSNSLAQAVVDDYLARHDFERRLPVLRRFYRRRAERLASAVRRAIPSWRFELPAGGFGVWIETDAAVDERRFLQTAVEERVSFDPGTGFEAWPTRGPTTLRLCFSLARPAEFEEATRRLARAWRRAARGAPRAGRAREGREGTLRRSRWMAAPTSPAPAP